MISNPKSQIPNHQMCSKFQSFSESIAMDLDPRTSTILMECLLARPISNRHAAGLLRALPVSLDSPRIKILVLVRRFDDFPLPFSSPEILSVLELLFKLAPSSSSSSSSSSIQIAYSAVALHLTPRHRDEADFEDAASQIWDARVEALKKSEELKGLVSKRLEEDGELVMKAVCSRTKREKMLYLRDTGKEAEVAVRVCLEDVVKSLSPSALDVAMQQEGNPAGVGVSEREGEERTVVEDILVCWSGGDTQISRDPSPHNVGDRKKRMAVKRSAHQVKVEVCERVRTRSQSGRIPKSMSFGGEIKKGKKKKKKRKFWSPEEVECLIQGVKKYGTSNWNTIRLKHPIFKVKSRSSMDLRDKWRNIIKKARKS